jgi:hypothetical protein
VSKIKGRQVDDLKLDNGERKWCLNTEVINEYRGTNCVKSSNIGL